MKTNPLATIRKRQTLFRSLTGITQDKFDELLKRTTPLYSIVLSFKFLFFV